MPARIQGHGPNLRAEKPAKLRRLSVNLQLEPLDHRVMPVVGAFNVPQAIRPSASTAGVVLIRQSPEDVGGASGTLLPGGQYILTAAHVVDSNGDHLPDASKYYVNFDLPAGRVQMVVPSNRIQINPQWQGATDDGFKNGHDLAVMKLSALAPWGNGQGNLSFELYTGSAMKPGTSSALNSVDIVGYGYTGDGTVGQNTSPHPDQISSTFQRLMLPPTARGSFTLGNPATKANIRLDAQGLTADVVQKSVQSLDSSGFTDVQVVQITDKNSPYFGSFDIVFRQVDTARYPYGNVPQLTFRPQMGFSGGSQGRNYRTGVMRPAFPTILGAKTSAGTRFNVNPEGFDNVFVSQLTPTRGQALLGEGDSGGPALLRRQIVGVASFYSGDSQYNDFSGWSSVSADLGWIQTNSKEGGNLVIDLATQPITKGHAVDYVSVKGSPNTDRMVVLVHGRQVFSTQMSSVKSVEIVTRGVPTQHRVIGKPTFTVNQIQNSQKGYLGKVGRVPIMGQTDKSPAVIHARLGGYGTAAASVTAAKKNLYISAAQVQSVQSSIDQWTKSMNSSLQTQWNSMKKGFQSFWDKFT